MNPDKDPLKPTFPRKPTGPRVEEVRKGGGKRVLGVEFPPIPGCDCYPGCWADHSDLWYRVAITNANRIAGIVEWVAQNIPYGSAVTMSDHIRVHTGALHDLLTTQFKGDPMASPGDEEITELEKVAMKMLAPVEVPDNIDNRVARMTQCTTALQKLSHTDRNLVILSLVNLYGLEGPE